MNGKSKLLELFNFAFGEYCGTFPVTLFTGKRAQSNAATPEVAASKGKRFMQVDEPEDGANINVGLMKNYTGGDKINARSLFKEPVEFKPQFKIVLVCNDLPKVPPYDGGVWRRLEVVEFISKFVDDPKEEYEFPRDNDLKDKLENWKETFMSILLHYYKIYKKEGLTAPDEVTKFTKEFQKDCDIYSDFISQRLDQTSDLTIGIKPSEIFREFKVWHAENNIAGRVISHKELMVYLEKRFTKKIVTNEIVKGFQLKKSNEHKFSCNDTDDIDENDDLTQSGDDETDIIHIEAVQSPFPDL